MTRRVLATCALLLALAAVAARAAAPVDPLIRAQLAATARADVFVKMAGETDASAARRIADKTARRWRAHDLRVSHAGRSQATLRDFLDRRGVAYRIFWINDSLFVAAADPGLVEAFAGFPGVAYLRGNHEVPLLEAVAVRPAPAAGRGVEWGVTRVRAPEVWATGNRGQGVVVASVDTGVRWTHEALRGSYRGGPGDHDYNWWDPDGVLAEPTDDNGHGTHVTGTMVGDDGAGNQIGVAPGATWIAAQGCDGASCSDLDLISSAQFLLCPTRLDGSAPDCSRAPDLVDNSWGGAGGDPWYESYVGAYVDAGILAVFPTGGGGPACGTLGSPADYRLTLSVTATTPADLLASFAGRGPSLLTARPQPDLSAPGVEVRSAYHTSDSAYVIFSGTSMAAPHAVGTLALVLSEHPQASLRNVLRSVLSKACQALLGNPGGALTCGGVPWDSFPSNHYGWGLVDAAAALGIAEPCGAAR